MYYNLRLPGVLSNSLISFLSRSDFVLDDFSIWIAERKKIVNKKLINYQ